MTTRLFVVRHGRTALNAGGVLRGHLDVRLDDVGVSEAGRLGELFAHVPIAIVVTSPLARARTTAQAIADASGMCCAVDERLIDRDYGAFAGETPASIEERFGSLDAAPGVEPVDVMRARAIAVVDDLVRAMTDAAAVVVAHDAVNRVVLAALVQDLDQPVVQPTGCWNELREDDGTWRAVVVGATPGDGHEPGL